MSTNQTVFDLPAAFVSTVASLLIAKKIEGIQRQIINAFEYIREQNKLKNDSRFIQKDDRFQVLLDSLENRRRMLLQDAESKERFIKDKLSSKERFWKEEKENKERFEREQRENRERFEKERLERPGNVERVTFYYI